MSNPMAKLVKEKLEEYNIKIFRHTKAEDNQEVIFAEHMVIFIYPDESISVTFQATTKPDDSALDILCLKEIPNIKIHIMEAFIYNNDNKILYGKEAYSLVHETVKKIGADEYSKEEIYRDILTNNEGFKC